MHRLLSLQPPLKTALSCPQCGEHLKLRKRQGEHYWSCSGYKTRGCELWEPAYWDDVTQEFLFIPPPTITTVMRSSAPVCMECRQVMRYRRVSPRMKGVPSGVKRVWFCSACRTAKLPEELG
jgi:ssDNA-binding Zn-finger/Zn-ribbon topoisomerase 1